MAAGRILIIEDETRLRHNLQILLSRAGYTVTTAVDGRDGIACLRHASFDVVITDLMMHEVDGFKAMEYMAAQAQAIPVIVISGYASTASAMEAIREGAYDYIAKPFDIEILQVAIERALEKVSLQRELQACRQDLENQVAERTEALEETSRQLHRSLAELQAAHEQCMQSEKLSTLGELLASVTHELRHPLGLILGYAESLVTSSVCPPEVRFGPREDQAGGAAWSRNCHKTPQFCLPAEAGKNWHQCQYDRPMARQTQAPFCSYITCAPWGM